MAFVPAALWHSKPFFAPKALYFLVIDCPAFCAGVVIRGPKRPSWMVHGLVAQPGPQRRIRIARGGRDRFVALGGSMVPGDAAGELLADPSRAAGDERLAAGVPGRDVSLRDLLERDFLQFRISQKPLERGVFTLEVFEPLDVLPPDRMAACPARRTESICGESPLRRSSARPGLVTRAAETAIERPGPHCVPVAGRIEALLQVEGLSNSG